MLKTKGWIVPNYNVIAISVCNFYLFLKFYFLQAPIGAEEVEILRVVGQSFFTVNINELISHLK